VERPKTYKREVALGLVLFLLGLFVWGVWDERAMQAAEFLTLPVFAFLGGAFGMDAFAKQIQR